MARSFNLLSFAARGHRRKPPTTAANHSFRFEALEPRIALAADGLVPVGYQPTGPLTGKIVYTSGGHGIEYEGGSTNNGWLSDRPDYNEIVEDFGNQDQLTYFADYLLRAGATVVPMRPVGHQLNEVVLDNDLPAVTYTGTWSNSSSTRYYDEDYGATADTVPYRYASTAVGAETAVATYTPNIPEEGFYPVYTWVLAGTDRTSQLYKINHTGGQTQIRVDHSKVGSGWVYLGTYHFDAGSSASMGSVQISNEGAAGKVVIADAIRFGNGMGDLREGAGGFGTGTVSGYPREDESSYFWLYRSMGMGITPSSVLGTGNVSAPSNMAQYMNQNSNPFGTSVYISFHSNGTTGDPATATARGAMGLYDSSAATPHQTDLALFTGRQINQDLQALNGVFENNWSNRTTHSSSGDFGEIDLGLSAEMDATIIEVGFHDNTLDSQMLRDQKVRDQIGRSTYEAVLEYFDAWGGLNAPTTVASAPKIASAVSNSAGEVTLTWSAGPSGGVYGAAATGYRIYASVDGYGFDGGTLVSGAGTTTATLAGYDPTIPYFFKIVAVNAGGESKASEVLNVLPSGGPKQILVVSGFDRFDRTQNARYPYYSPAGNLVDRVWARYNNSFDYTVQVAEAIQASTSGVHVASASNEAIISGAVNLADYDAVIWILGNESTTNRTFDATEQTKVEAFIAGGGHLFVTGSEIGWDLDQANNGRSFFEGTLKSNYVADDANTYNVVAPVGGIFAGLTFSFDNGAQYYNVSYPDVIAPQAGAISALTYSGGTGGSAGVQVAGTGGRGNIVVFGFPFETITTTANRAAVMDRVLDFFGVGAVVPPTPTGDFNGDGIVDGADFLAWQRGFGAAAPTLAEGDADQNGVVDGADLETWKTQYGNVAAPPAESFAMSGAQAALMAETDVEEQAAAASAIPTSLGWLSQRPSTVEVAVAEVPLALMKSHHAKEVPALQQVGEAKESVTPRRARGFEPARSAGATGANAVDLAFEDRSLDGDWSLFR
ncbi:N-acetylmuramoyl-L-alanine amidase [Lacipirellula parvula]|uniref:Fibronectin type-III domain-containing protein n=1 Tax=Lacipirellula parvula TaxID=2650471 RepID=A0A5K7XDJ0_9BACT|nr:N-acetylmuramoyl-L-alanine amidase [Lacipirellula parvula]BBO34820.1 hypothetical protein PLANPX_4432 [Lacipirellula parvula]